MSCFWDTLIKNIKSEDLEEILDLKTKKPTDFCSALQLKNCKTENVRWNENELTEKQYEENIEWVKNYQTNTIGNGYDCSIFDPFLFLIVELFKIEIHHLYNGTMIHYQYNGDVKYIIHIQNNKGHMW